MRYYDFYPTSSGGTTPFLPVPPDFKGGDCLALADQYQYPPTIVPFGTDDAIDDAMYRLLSQPLDPQGEGAINLSYNANMTFQADGKIGIQTLWGPVKMRLVIWS